MVTEKEFMKLVDEWMESREFQIADCREYCDGKYNVPKGRKVSPKFIARNIYQRFIKKIS